MTADREDAFTLVFVGYADPGSTDRAVAFEDAVLPILADHGARLLFRGRRANGEDTALPLEVHVIWFPHREAFASYLADDRRRALVERYGEPFTSEHVVEVETIRELPPPGGQ